MFSLDWREALVWSISGMLCNDGEGETLELMQANRDRRAQHRLEGSVARSLTAICVVCKILVDLDM